VRLQQYSIEYPTLAAVIRGDVAVYGLLLPTLGFTWAIRRFGSTRLNGLGRPARAKKGQFGVDGRGGRVVRSRSR